MVPQYPGLWGNLSGLPSTLTSIFRSCCVSFFEGRRPEGKECLRSANRLKPQWNVFPCSVTHSASLSVPQTGPRGTQRCPGDWRPPSPGSRHRLRAAGSLLGCSRVGTENGHRQSENGHRHCHCLLTFSQQSQTEEEIFFSFRGGIGIPPSVEGPDGAVTQLKLVGGRREREYLLRTWLENKIMETSCCFKKGFCR